MARVKKHSVCWTIMYAFPIQDDDFWTASWFAYGRSEEEAKANFLKNWEEDEYFGNTTIDKVIIVGVREGFTC